MSQHPAAFSQNQPVPLGRHGRVSVPNEAYSEHQARLKKNAATALKRAETINKNQQARTGRPPGPPQASSPIAPQTGSSIPTPTPVRAPRPALRTIQAQGSPSPLFSTPRVPSSSTPSTPRLLRPVEESVHPSYPNLQQMYPQTGFVPQRSDLRPVSHQSGVGTAFFAPDIEDISTRLLANQLSQEELASLTLYLKGCGPLPDSSSTFDAAAPPLLTFDTEDEGVNNSIFDASTQVATDHIDEDYDGDGPESPLPFEQEQDPASDDETDAHKNAQSSLNVEMHDVQVHPAPPRRRRREQRAASTDSGSEAEQPPAQRQRRNKAANGGRKRGRRNQPSRSIRDVQVHRQPVVKAANGLIQQKIVVEFAFPIDSPTGRPGADDDQSGNMVLDSWDDAHDVVECPYVGEPDKQEKNLVWSRAPTVRGAFKKAAIQFVQQQYKFVDLQTLTDPTPERLDGTTESNRDILVKIEDTYYYANPYNTTIPDSMYRTGIFQNVFNVCCFGSYANNRAHYFKDKDEIPVETLALIVTAVKCAIDEWKTGRRVLVKFEHDAYAPVYNKVLTHLRGWVAFSGKQDVDLAKRLRTEMLRIARSTASGKDVVTVEEPSTAFNFSAYAANQPAAV